MKNRIKEVLEVLLIIIYIIWHLVRVVLVSIVWFCINFLDLILLIPLFFVWLIFGRNYMFNLEYAINEKTGIFECIYLNKN